MSEEITKIQNKFDEERRYKESSIDIKESFPPKLEEEVKQIREGLIIINESIVSLTKVIANGLRSISQEIKEKS